jgi:flagellar hook assembly protein FlgD
VLKFNATDRLKQASLQRIVRLRVELNPPGVNAVSATSIRKAATTSTIKYTLTEATTSTILQIRDGETVIAQINGGKLVGPNTATWNGTNSTTKQPVAEKTYTLRIIATDAAGKATTVNSTLIVDRTLPTISELAAGEPVEQTREISYSLSETVKLTAVVRQGTSKGTIVKTLLSAAEQTEGAQTLSWDGKNNAGANVANGTYVVVLTAVDAAGNSAVAQLSLVISS